MTAISSALLLLGAAGLAAVDLPPDAASAVSRSVVTIRVTGQHHSWRTPWTKLDPWSRTVNGVVVDGRRVLVPGHAFGNHTLVEVQKLGQPQRYPAQVKLIDYEAPLALLEVEDGEFWAGLQPLPLAERVSREGDVTVHRWLESGQPESARATVRQVKSSDHGMARTELLSLELTSTLQNGGAGEVVVADGKLLGLTTAKNNDVLTAIAAPALAQFLAMAARPVYPGFARGGFSWQRMLNPALRDSLGMAKDESGILVNRVLPHGSAAGTLEARDVILEIAGLKLDSSGQVDHPRYGKLFFGVLFTDGRQPGDQVDIKVLRAGKRQALKMTLRRMLPEQDRIPSYVLDHAPEYAEYGGLVFQHLTIPYLASNPEWRRRAPLRLLVSVDLDSPFPTPEHPRVVVLTQVLPDAANLGYQDLRDLVVTQVNGVPARTLEDVRAAFAKPQGGFHVVEFLPGQGVSRIVLDAAETEAAEPRVQALYGAPAGH